ncbi:hypothetical protein FMN50_20310 [Rhodobacterales bacterium]|nr:hypothetical protein FMN50_20310 [Rhodobacterales bacterium]
MSGGPQFGKRLSQPLDMMLDQVAGPGFVGIDKLMEPVVPRERLQAPDEVAKTLAKLLLYPGGRAVLEWMMDISLRQHFTSQGQSLEAVALHAKQKEGIDGFAAVILAEIVRGQQLLEKE